MTIYRPKTSNKCVLADGGHTNVACCVMQGKGKGLSSICSLVGVDSSSVSVPYAAAYVPGVSSVLHAYKANFAVQRWDDCCAVMGGDDVSSA